MTYGGYHFLLLSSFLITAIAIADVIYTIAVANAIVGVIKLSFHAQLAFTFLFYTLY
jgi:hypothetical protein